MIRLKVLWQLYGSKEHQGTPRWTGTFPHRIRIAPDRARVPDVLYETKETNKG